MLTRLLGGLLGRAHTTLLATITPDRASVQTRCLRCGSRRTLASSRCVEPSAHARIDGEDSSAPGDQGNRARAAAAGTRGGHPAGTTRRRRCRRRRRRQWCPEEGGTEEQSSVLLEEVKRQEKTSRRNGAVAARVGLLAGLLDIDALLSIEIGTSRKATDDEGKWSSRRTCLRRKATKWCH